MRVLTTVIAHPDSLTGSSSPFLPTPARLCVYIRRTDIRSLLSALKKTCPHVAGFCCRCCCWMRLEKGCRFIVTMLTNVFRAKRVFIILIDHFRIYFITYWIFKFCENFIIGQTCGIFSWEIEWFGSMHLIAVEWRYKNNNQLYISIVYVNKYFDHIEIV